ncbi:hypothetical protein [Streptomyces sp. NPDC002994]|uniref:hypothetical protein n=1 Tax=Streptomyces sp. NPDC002994 TaxID=3154441 RepID=UPI0033A95422
MAWPHTPLRITTELLIAGEWVDISIHVLNRQPLKINWGRKDEASKVSHSKVALQLNNRDGWYSNRNPNSPYYGLLRQNTPIRISVVTPSGAVSYRFHGEVSEFPQRWDLSGRDVYVTIKCAGILRRLDQGTKPLKDPLRRHIEGHGPLAYWPLTDGEDARHGTEVVASGTPMRAVGESGSFYQGQPDWGRGNLAPWLDPVVDLPDETIGHLATAVQPHSFSRWSVDHCIAGGGEGYANTFEIWDNGPRLDSARLVQRSVTTDPLNDRLRLHITEWGDTGVINSFPATITGSGIFDDHPHHIRLSVADDGAGGTNWEMHVDGLLKASGNHASSYRPVGKLSYRWGTVEGGGTPTKAIALGHIAYWGATTPEAADTYRAMRGYERELAGRRIERLCAEHGVPLAVTGSLDTTPQMGPQRSGALLELLDTAAKVDGGVIYESRTELGLAYRTNRSRYNQGV